MNSRPEGDAARSDSTAGGGQPGGRTFAVDGVEWSATVAGQGIGGSDAFAGRALQVVYFARAEAPGTPLFQVVTPLRALGDLFDDEFAALLAQAQPIVEPGSRQESGSVRRTGRGPMHDGPEQSRSE
jgi:hypothetical protein